MHSATLPLVTGLVMPRNGLVAVVCPHCAAWHTHTRAGITRAPCGASYRLKINGTATKAEEQAIRMAIGRALINAANSRGEAPGREAD